MKEKSWRNVNSDRNIEENSYLTWKSGCQANCHWDHKSHPLLFLMSDVPITAYWNSSSIFDLTNKIKQHLFSQVVLLNYWVPFLFIWWTRTETHVWALGRHNTYSHHQNLQVCLGCWVTFKKNFQTNCLLVGLETCIKCIISRLTKIFPLAWVGTQVKGSSQSDNSLTAAK